VDPISLTIDGVLCNDPRPFTTNAGTAGVSLRLEVTLPDRGSSGDSKPRYVKALAFGTLAANVAASLSANDRVTVRADDIRADAWRPKDQPRDDDSIRSCVPVIARTISPSLMHDTVTTGSTTRRAVRTAAANGQGGDLPAAEQADLQVLAGVAAAP
jgi:Single-strand binding protein family